MTKGAVAWSPIDSRCQCGNVTQFKVPAFNGTAALVCYSLTCSCGKTANKWLPPGLALIGDKAPETNILSQI